LTGCSFQVLATLRLLCLLCKGTTVLHDCLELHGERLSSPLAWVCLLYGTSTCWR
jgi:hypothetical protein